MGFPRRSTCCRRTSGLPASAITGWVLEGIKQDALRFAPRGFTRRTQLLVFQSKHRIARSPFRILRRGE
jgi:hypothetical protein